jgi:PhzF family phenazine biosynthesis protein
MEFAFKQVDVFTGKPFQGNPVAVVIGAEGLGTETMQRIANWTNLSETTFLLKSSVADYKLRIFTPRMELPFAGHPTIGSAHAALEAEFVPRKSNLKQECGAGVLELAVEDGRISVKSPTPRLEPLKPAMASAFGVPLIPGTPFVRVDVGPKWAVGEISGAAALAALKPDMTALAEWSESLHLTGVTVFAKSDDRDSAIHVRSFAPAHGVAEDPVCGSGNISVAAYLRETGKLEEIGKTYVARQGMQLGRDGRVYMRVDEKDIYLGGNAVTTVDGKIAT